MKVRAGFEGGEIREKHTGFKVGGEIYAPVFFEKYLEKNSFFAAMKNF